MTMARQEMFQMQLSDAANALNAELLGDDVAFQRVSTDSRSIGEGELFVALHGERFDGHDYVEVAEKNGAVATMIHRDVQTNLPRIRVDDTRLSLGSLAGYWRQQFDMPVIAVTGSNGKTTVKEMIAAILSQVGSPLVTQGNLNNDIGLPLTLLRMQTDHTHAVLEMGANHPGEIAYLVGLGKPDVAMINNAMAAHLEGFGSLDGVAKAKAEIYAGLSDDGIAVINADDDYAEYWQQQCAGLTQLLFGLSSNAQVTATDITSTTSGSQFTLVTPDGSTDIALSLPGKHNVMNALAATACCIAIKTPLEAIKQGLATLQPVSGRLQTLPGVQSSKVIHDAYNANPDSFRSAIAVLKEHDGRTILVMGDMGELGENAAAAHQEIGALAKQQGINYLFTLGDLSQAATQGFGDSAEHFSDVASLNERLSNELTANCCVLVKGSRLMKMERVVEAITKQEDAR